MEGSKKLKRQSNVSHLVLDGTDMFVAYEDYGLDMVTLPLLDGRSVHGSTEAQSDVTKKSDVLRLSTMIRGRETLVGAHKLSRAYL